MPLWKDGEVYNTTVLLTPAGELVEAYEKIHLFDIELEGKKPIRESDYYAFGKQPSVVEYRGWKIGLSICYDLRFSELYRLYAEEKADVLMIPAAFLVETGKAHWEVLMRARAIECEAYVIAAAQCGKHVSPAGKERFSYGHSLVTAPWGEIRVKAGNEEAVLKTILKKSEIEKMRRQIPMADHRRL